MFTRNVGWLRELVIMIALSACTARPLNSTPVLSTSTPAATASRVPSTRTPRPTSTPPPTATIPPLPNDKRFIASIDVGAAPWTMSFANGSLWVIAGNSVVQINPQTNKVVGKPISVDVPRNARLEAIVADEDGLWVTIIGGGNIGVPNEIDSVVRLDPQTGETVATIKVRRGPVSLAYTPGIVWVVNWGAHLLTRIDSKTNQIIGEPFRPGAAPYSITVGDGSIWVVNHDDGALTRIDPETDQILAEIVSAYEPHRVAFGEDAVWLGNWHDLTVSRVDPQTNQIVGEPIPVGYAAGSVAAGDGNIWVTSDYRGVDAYPEAFPDHTVLIRIDPKTNKVVDTIQLGGHPVDVEVIDGAVWVTIQNPDYVLKIQPD